MLQKFYSLTSLNFGFQLLLGIFIRERATTSEFSFFSPGAYLQLLLSGGSLKGQVEKSISYWNLDY